MPGWIISSQSGGTWKWNWKGSEVARRDVNGISDVRDDSWHHVAVSHDRKGLARFFVNGVQLRTISIEDDGDVDTDMLGYAVNIGQDGTGSYGAIFQDLLIDDLGIWRRALDEQDVATIHAAGLQGLDLSRIDELVTELAIESVRREGDTVTLSWPGGPGIRLQRTPSLQDPEWIDVEGTEGSSSFTGSIDQPSAYYRLSR
jgi:hypothetical protein